MEPGDSLRAFLLADGTIAALVVAGGIGRIYPDELPQGPTYPAARYTLVSEQDQYASRGPLNLTRMRWQIDCYAPKKREANALARAVRNRLRGYKGIMGDHTVQGVFAETSRSGREPEAEPPISFVSRDYIIWFED